MPGYGAAAPAAPMNMQMPNTPAAPMAQTGGCGCNGGAQPAQPSTEAATAFEDLFNQIDANNDGSIDMQEFMEFLQGSMMENGMRDSEAAGEQEVIDGQTPASDAAAAQGDVDHGHSHGEEGGEMAAMPGMEQGSGDMGGAPAAGPATAPVAPPMAMCG